MERLLLFFIGQTVQPAWAHFLVFGQVPAQKLDNYRKQVDAVLATIRLPGSQDGLAPIA